jgi:hypothetical protein
MRKAGTITEDEYQAWKVTLSHDERPEISKRVPDIHLMASFAHEETALMDLDPKAFNRFVVPNDSTVQGSRRKCGERTATLEVQLYPLIGNGSPGHVTWLERCREADAVALGVISVLAWVITKARK